MSKKKPGTPSNTIALNKKAKHEYHIEERFEAGLSLLGWEVKSLRAGKAQLVDAYVLLKDGEAWLLGSHITPLIAASTHVIADPTRTRKLLLHRQLLVRQGVEWTLGLLFQQKLDGLRLIKDKVVRIRFCGFFGLVEQFGSSYLLMLEYITLRRGPFSL